MVLNEVKKKRNRWFLKGVAILVIAAFFMQHILWAEDAAVSVQPISTVQQPTQIFQPVQPISDAVPITQTQPAPESQTTTTIEFLQSDSPLSAPTNEEEEEKDPDANPNLEGAPRIICAFPCGSDPLPEAEPIPNSSSIEPKPLDPNIQVTGPVYQPPDLSSQNQIEYGEAVPVESGILDPGQPIQPVEEEHETSYPGLGGFSVYAYSTIAPSQAAEGSEAEAQEEAGEESRDPSGEVVFIEHLPPRAFSGNAAMSLSVVSIAAEKQHGLPDQDPADGAVDVNPPKPPKPVDQAALAAQALWWRLSIQNHNESQAGSPVSPQVGFHSQSKRRFELHPRRDLKEESYALRKRQKRKRDRSDILIHIKEEGESIRKLKFMEGGSYSTD